MSLTTDEPTHEPDPNPLDLDALESQLKARQTRRDGWTLMIFAFARSLCSRALWPSASAYAIDESKQGGAIAAAPAGSPGDAKGSRSAADDLGVAVRRHRRRQQRERRAQPRGARDQPQDCDDPGGRRCHLDRPASPRAPTRSRRAAAGLGHAGDAPRRRLDHGPWPTARAPRRQRFPPHHHVAKADGRRDEASLAPHPDRRARRSAADRAGRGTKQFDLTAAMTD